jgi:TPR repeat protein
MSGRVRIISVTFNSLPCLALLLAAAGLAAFVQTSPAALGRSFADDLQRAESGEALGMAAVAHRYEHGTGCPRDAGQAILWYRRAAALNEPSAIVALGHIYDEGKCVDQNMGEAVRLFRIAAELGNPAGMYRLGYMVEHGRGVRGDRDEAIKWYLKAAALGNPEAMLALGNLTGERQWFEKAVAAGEASALAKLAAYKSGGEAQALYRRGAELGDPAAIYEVGRLEEERDIQRAAKLYLQAAQAGHPAAMSRYAEFAERGLAGVRQSSGEAAVWYTKAAEAGDPAGLTWKARRIEPKSADDAYELYRRAASAGYVPAMTRLGVLSADCALMRKAAHRGDAEGMFEFASRCRPSDAREWYWKAADRGHVESMAIAGRTKEAAEAGHRPSMLVLARTDASWLRRAADAGIPEAMRLYAATQSDPGEAARWFVRSAEAGDAAGMAEAGRRFEKGIGVAADRATALKWYRAGAENGDASAMLRLGMLDGDASWIRKAAEAGVPEAMCRLGESLEDKQQAVAWYRKAADAGYANGWTRIAMSTGDESLYERAAQLGDAEAKFRLGELAYGRKKRREAYRLFLAAASAGYAPAMIRAGDCHLEGDGASVSEVDAVNWYRRAALAGDSQGLAKLQRLGKTQ